VVGHAEPEPARREWRAQRGVLPQDLGLGERWNGTRWGLQAVPSPVGAAENQLNGIACPATNACMAVGTVGPTRGVFSTEALWWNGRTWHLQQTPTLPEAGLNAVGCASETDCVAVGQSNAGALAERWDGDEWAIQATPNPSGSPGSSLNGVTCTSASFCSAVGGRTDSSGNPAGTLAERWNGLGLVNNFSAACPARSTCIAAGGFENDGPGAKTLTEQWRATGTAATLTAPGSSSPRAYTAIAGCIRTALGEGVATGAAATRMRPTIKAQMPQRSQRADEIEQITSLCSAA